MLRAAGNGDLLSTISLETALVSWDLSFRIGRLSSYLLMSVTSSSTGLR